MNSNDSTIIAVDTVDCRKVRRNLPGMLLEDLDSSELSSLLNHLSQCPGCLKVHLAFQAAAELASPLTNDAGCCE